MIILGNVCIQRDPEVFYSDTGMSSWPRNVTPKHDELSFTWIDQQMIRNGSKERLLIMKPGGVTWDADHNKRYVKEKTNFT